MNVSVVFVLDFQIFIMCRISHCHFFFFFLFVLLFRTEHSTYFILSKVCHFVGRLKHKKIIKRTKILFPGFSVNDNDDVFILVSFISIVILFLVVAFSYNFCQTSSMQESQ